MGRDVIQRPDWGAGGTTVGGVNDVGDYNEFPQDLAAGTIVENQHGNRSIVRHDWNKPEDTLPARPEPLPALVSECWQSNDGVEHHFAIAQQHYATATKGMSESEKDALDQDFDSLPEAARTLILTTLGMEWDDADEAEDFVRVSVENMLRKGLMTDADIQAVDDFCERWPAVVARVMR